MTKKTCPSCGSQCGCATRVCRQCQHRFLPRRADVSAPAAAASAPSPLTLGPRQRKPSLRAVESARLGDDDEYTMVTAPTRSLKRKAAPEAPAVLPDPPLPEADLFSLEPARQPGTLCELCRTEDGAPEWLPALRVGGEAAFVHAACALTAGGVSCVRAPATAAQHWYNVARAVVAARQQTCALCGQRGAGTRCSRSACAVHVHSPCAARAEAWGLVTPYLCHEHRQREEHDARLGQLRDLSGGVELQPLLWTATPGVAPANWRVVDAEQPPRDFTYVSGNVRAEGVELASAATALPCCDCADGCVSAECACRVLAQQRQDVRVECSLRCACRLDKCALRVVGRPLRVPITVAKFHGGWGLMCPVELGVGELVCEVAGLVRRAREGDAANPLVHAARDWLQGGDVAAVGECPTCASAQTEPAVSVALAEPQWPPASATATAARHPPIEHMPAALARVEVPAAALDSDLVVDLTSHANMARYLRRGCAAHRNVRRVAVLADAPDGRLPRLIVETSKPVQQREFLL